MNGISQQIISASHVAVKIFYKMNTFAKAGRIALLHLFSKKEGIFGTTRYQELGMASSFLRKVSISKKEINLEKKYLSCVVNAYGRHNSYRIFMWSVELGLSEILLSRDNEGQLIDLICRCSDGPLSHIVIAVEYRDHNDDSSKESEEIIIYSLNEEQKRYISDKIHNDELDQFESAEDFTFSHGYFPKKGIVGTKR